MAVLEPIPLTITNYPDDQTEFLTADNHPQRDDTREISFSKHLWIDADDFMIDPPRKYFRMFPGNEVRLKHAYIVRCTGYDVDDDGHVTHVYAEYDPDSRAVTHQTAAKWGTIHWVDQNTAYEVDINLYEYLFTVEDPDNAEGGYDQSLMRILCASSRVANWKHVWSTHL